MMVGLATCAEEDKISNLPEHLIDSILERLPVQDAVRTSILSKKWRYRWTKMGALIFDEHFFKKYAENAPYSRKFVRIINKVLILHKGPISKFLLHIPKMGMYLYGFEDVDQWMMLLLRNGVRELILTSSSQSYKLPRYMFSCLELTNLKLENCLFKPPLGFEGFINLQHLHLQTIDFTGNFSGTQINLPKLKSLCLDTCTNVYNFNIKATKLQVLHVLDCPDAMFCRLFHSPCLTHVAMCLPKPMGKFTRVERMTLAMMLSNLPEMRGLVFDGIFFTVLIPQKIPKWLPHPVNSLKTLCFLNFKFGDLNQLHGALCLLRNSPNLEIFSVRTLETECRVIRYDMGPASNHLESPHCLDCTLDRLQIVEIRHLKGSKPEMLFIKLLLAHSPSLKKFIIIRSGTCAANDIAKDVMWFPRASPKAKMIYLNSKT
ncbi:unnamed protein product [Lactuca virosa]|uniref:F-box domain-containing protein n=1 Tax=Lactuca virosa TaxID=75947 RepID=A0AAU9NTB4_9ASTR|nr:unnamed protein product [Lactuca virosa]